MAIIGATADSAPFVRSIKSTDGAADLVIHSLSAPLPPAGAASPPAPTPLEMAAMAGRAGAALGAREVVLWAQSSALMLAPHGEDPAFLGDVIHAARAELGRDPVSLAGRFFCHMWERDAGGTRAGDEESAPASGGGAAPAPSAPEPPPEQQQEQQQQE